MLSQEQQLEIRTNQEALQKERQIFELEKMNIESELIFQREKHQMME